MLTESDQPDSGSTVCHYPAPSGDRVVPSHEWDLGGNTLFSVWIFFFFVSHHHINKSSFSSLISTLDGVFSFTCQVQATT